MSQSKFLALGLMAAVGIGLAVDVANAASSRRSASYYNTGYINASFRDDARYAYTGDNGSAAYVGPSYVRSSSLYYDPNAYAMVGSGYSGVWQSVCRAGNTGLRGIIDTSTC